MRYAMIMAGGSGTRLWPMSRKSRPKQLLPLICGKSLLEVAAARLQGPHMLVPQERCLICTAEQFRSSIRQSLPQFSDDQILGEPQPRDTVNAIGLTAAVLMQRDPKLPGAMFAVLTADHLIEPQEEFARAMELGFRVVEDDPSRFVTFSIKPTYAATGYGYVEQSKPLPGGGFAGAYVAGRFVEKPDAATAQSLVASGNFNWNSGMFIFNAAKFMEAMKWFLRENYEGLMRIGEVWNTLGASPQAAADLRQSIVNQIYPTLKKISVDYGIMEPASKDPRLTICTVPMNVKWTDIGSWPTYGETLMPDASGNRTNAAAQHIDSRNIVALSDDPKHLIATIGCEDLIIVHTNDVTLVCKASEAQRVKDMAGLVDPKHQ